MTLLETPRRSPGLLAPGVPPEWGLPAGIAPKTSPSGSLQPIYSTINAYGSLGGSSWNANNYNSGYSASGLRSTVLGTAIALGNAYAMLCSNAAHLTISEGPTELWIEWRQGATTATRRDFIGLASSPFALAMIQADDPPAQAYCGVQFSTVRGDASLQVAYKPTVGGVQTLIPTGVLPSIVDWRLIRLFFRYGDFSIRIYNAATNALLYRSGRIASGLAAPVTTCWPAVMMDGLAAVTHSFAIAPCLQWTYRKNSPAQLPRF